ncbi:MAG TPA: SDR family oxidoreductase, partial [Pseudonocardia sp.]|nr:SDR family oxidoreductase [Pseudonocardia sp.]
MEIDGARTLVAGATGVLGSALAAALRREGARVAVAGRSERIADDPQAFPFDALDLDRCAAVVDAAADALGGLDLLVVAFGVAAFGPAVDEDDALVEELLTVNTMAPMAMVRAALRRMERGATVTVLSAILADVPTAGMAAYTASKCALSGWLTALRLEQRSAANCATTCERASSPAASRRRRAASCAARSRPRR